ncbi:MAG: phosphoribosyltransferase family protein [Wenzhouxiangellaceae bacterium]
MMPAGAYRLFDAAEVASAYDRIAERLNDELPKREILLLPVMTGGMFPACELARRIRRPLRLDYVHATRYRGQTSGSQLEWLHWPEFQSKEQSVLLIDDIFDEGHTLAAILDRLPEQYQVTTAALALKQHDRGLSRDWLDHHGIVVPDVYVFGCGMDYRENYRELPDIWAMATDD